MNEMLSANRIRSAAQAPVATCFSCLIVLATACSPAPESTGADGAALRRVPTTATKSAALPELVQEPGTVAPSDVEKLLAPRRMPTCLPLQARHGRRFRVSRRLMFLLAPAGSGALSGGLAVGNGNGDSTAVVSGTISWAEGSFPTVTGVSSITNNSGLANQFSLQLNSQRFSGVPQCAGHPGCQGWQQFVYNPAGLGGFQAGENFTVFMQYWLLGYGSPCPTGWAGSGNCRMDSNAGVSVVNPSAAALAHLVLTGTAGSTDTVMLSTGDGNIYAYSQASLFNLNQFWTTAEFNVFGSSNGAPATFNSGLDGCRADADEQRDTDDGSPILHQPKLYRRDQQPHHGKLLCGRRSPPGNSVYREQQRPAFADLPVQPRRHDN